MTDPKTDLTTTDGVIAHVTERTRAISERGGGVAHAESIRAAKEEAYMELFAELFGKLELLKDLVIAMGDAHDPDTPDTAAEMLRMVKEMHAKFCPRKSHSSS